MLIMSKWEGGAGHLFRFTLRYFSWYILVDIQWYGNPIRKKLRAHIWYLYVFSCFLICLFFCVQQKNESIKPSFYWVTYMTPFILNNLKRIIFAFCRTIIQNVFFGTIIPKYFHGHLVKLAQIVKKVQVSY